MVAAPASAEDPLVSVADDNRIEVGRQLLRAGKLQEADLLFETVLSQRPDLARANFYKGLMLQRRKSHSIALDWYQASLDANQNFPERSTVPYFMAWSAYHAGDPTQARVQIDRFLADSEVTPRADARFLSGLLHFDADRLDEAEADFRAAIERSEASNDLGEMQDMTRAWVRHADVLTRLGRDSEGLVAINRAIELNPDLMEAWFRKYTILTRLGDDPEALIARTRWQELRDGAPGSDSSGAE